MPGTDGSGFGRSGTETRLGLLAGCAGRQNDARRGLAVGTGVLLVALVLHLFHALLVQKLEIDIGQMQRGSEARVMASATLARR